MMKYLLIFGMVVVFSRMFYIELIDFSFEFYKCVVGMYVKVFFVFDYFERFFNSVYIVD